MEKQNFSTKLLSSSDIKTAAEIIRAGGTVAFPTETVYGLGADATNAEAVGKIFAAKGRPGVNPLIVHFASVRDIFAFFPHVDKFTRHVLRRVDRAITVVIPRGDRIPAITAGGLDSVAVRVPALNSARQLIAASGVPVAAPSANTSTRPSPTRWEDVQADLYGKIDAIITGEPTEIGLESTVVKVDGPHILVLRLGGYDTAKLAKKTGYSVELVTDASKTNASPGTRFRHYAPACPLLVAEYNETMNVRINEFSAGKNAVVLCVDANAGLYPRVLCLGKNAAEVSARLFTSLREAEKVAELIVCEGMPNTPEYEAVRERLKRASEGKTI